MSLTETNGGIPLTYKGHPLMRKDTMIYYGSTADKFVVLMQVMASEPKGTIKLSKKVKVELQYTDPEISSKDRVIKTAERVGLYNALDLASIWLERALNGK